MVDKNVLRARALVIERMRRRVKTALGTSEESYGQEDDEAEVRGEVQGKGDVPSLWCVQSDTLLRAHATRAHGMCLYNPTKRRRIKRCDTQFVDDNDGWTNAPMEAEDPISETVHSKYSMMHRDGITLTISHRPNGCIPQNQMATPGVEIPQR